MEASRSCLILDALCIPSLAELKCIAEQRLLRISSLFITASHKDELSELRCFRYGGMDFSSC